MLFAAAETPGQNASEVSREQLDDYRDNLRMSRTAAAANGDSSGNNKAVCIIWKITVPGVFCCFYFCGVLIHHRILYYSRCCLLGAKMMMSRVWTWS
jgi:hypothetical protein